MNKKRNAYCTKDSHQQLNQVKVFVAAREGNRSSAAEEAGDVTSETLLSVYTHNYRLTN